MKYPFNVTTFDFCNSLKNCYSVTAYKSAFVTSVTCNRHFQFPLHTLLHYPITFNVCIYNIYINIVTSVTVTRHCLKFNYLQAVTFFKNCYTPVTPVTERDWYTRKTLIDAQPDVKKTQKMRQKNTIHTQSGNYSETCREQQLCKLCAIVTITPYNRAFEDIFKLN